MKHAPYTSACSIDNSLCEWEFLAGSEWVADWQVTCPQCGANEIREYSYIPTGLSTHIEWLMHWSNISEKDFQKQVIGLAVQYNWLVYHVPPAMVNPETWVTPTVGHKGFPDLVLVAPFQAQTPPGRPMHPPRPNRKGGVIFAELKSRTGRLTADQESWKRRLTEQGAEYYVWRPENMAEIHARLSGYPIIGGGYVSVLHALTVLGFTALGISIVKTIWEFM
jgi:hypothetical protein